MLWACLCPSHTVRVCLCVPYIMSLSFGMPVWCCQGLTRPVALGCLFAIKPTQFAHPQPNWLPHFTSYALCLYIVYRLHGIPVCCTTGVMLYDVCAPVCMVTTPPFLCSLSPLFLPLPIISSLSLPSPLFPPLSPSLPPSLFSPSLLPSSPPPPPPSQFWGIQQCRWRSSVETLISWSILGLPAHGRIGWLQPR